MRIVCISTAQIPSDTANSIQVMKVCQAFIQLGLEVNLLVPGNQSSTIDDQLLLKHYGLEQLFPIEWLPVRNRRFFAWKAVRRAKRLGADLLYVWPLQSAALGLLIGMPSFLELHDFPSGRFGPVWLQLFLRLARPETFAADHQGSAKRPTIAAGLYGRCTGWSGYRTLPQPARG